MLRRESVYHSSVCYEHWRSAVFSCRPLRRRRVPGGASSGSLEGAAHGGGGRTLGCFDLPKAERTSGSWLNRAVWFMGPAALGF